MTRLALGGEVRQAGQARRPARAARGACAEQILAEQVARARRRRAPVAGARRRKCRRVSERAEALRIGHVHSRSAPSSRSRSDSGSGWPRSCRPPAPARPGVRRAATRPGSRTSRASSGRALKRASCRGERIAAGSAAPRGGGQPGRGETEGERRCAPSGVAPPSFIMRCASTRAASTYVHVVHQVERLQRRVGRRSGGRRSSRGSGRRSSPSSAAAPCASRRCRGCGDRGPRRGPGRSPRRSSARATGPAG